MKNILELLTHTIITHYIIVSSEDDKYLVKGGIGTYTGLLTRCIKAYFPHIEVSWITESPTKNDFYEVDEYGVHRYYLAKEIDKNLSNFVKKITLKFKQILGDIKNVEGYKVVFEAPEWEGLVASFFHECKDKNILKVSRIHSPLAITAELNNMTVDNLAREQMKREKKQMLYSDYLSSPTNFILNKTLNIVFKNSELEIERNVIPNCIETDNFIVDKLPGRTESIITFRNEICKKISEDDFNIFVLGSVERRKGVEIVVDSIADVCSKIPNACFYFIGHFNKNDNEHLTSNKKLTVKQLKSKLPLKMKDKANFVGYVNHSLIPLIMNAGDLFPICYLGDNFPGTVAEIALSERPIIALLKGGLDEMVITENRKVLVKTINGRCRTSITNSLINSIIDSFENYGRSIDMAKELKCHMLNNFSNKTIINTMLSSYSALLQRKSS